MQRNKFRPRYLINLAKQMRNELTPEEELLWVRIRRRQLEGFRFRRQHTIGRYITDFCCPEIKLIIEIDGAVHSDSKKHDESRDEYLAALGYRTVRFHNEELTHHIENVITSIRCIALEIKSNNAP